MTDPRTIIQAAATEPCRPWPRYNLTATEWSALAASPITLLGLWADTAQAHALYVEPISDQKLLVSVTVDSGRYPALSPSHRNAAWQERAIHDLWGHVADNGDARPWLDHGHWPHAQVMAIRPGPRRSAPEPPAFQEISGEALMQWPIGPVGAGIGEAAHLRLTLDGTKIVGAESRLGYSHRGIPVLMRAKSPRVAARFAARLAGDATVAHGLAFATATEAALGIEVPPRAIALRTLLVSIERVATHLDIIATLAGVLGARRLHELCGARQEYLRRSLSTVFGHRMAMDCVVPGGVSGDTTQEGLATLRQVLGATAAAIPTIRHLCEHERITDRLMASGVFDQCHTRLEAISVDTDAAISILTDLPIGPMTTQMPLLSGEGLGHAVSAAGEIWHWLRLDHGQIAAVFPIDPHWALWPRVETALIGAEAADAALICAAFGLRSAGMDL